jgi:S1-C subfamily serine protease
VPSNLYAAEHALVALHEHLVVGLIMMIPPDARRVVEQATVLLPETKGLGVRVGCRNPLWGEFILTAAHCVEHYNSGGMALGDSIEEEFILRQDSGWPGECYPAEVTFVDPVSDLAVLNVSPSVLVEFDEPSIPVPIADPVSFESGDMPIFIFSHLGKWIEGTAKIPDQRCGIVRITAVTGEGKSAILSGTSGGPVVDQKGNLLAIVSNSGDEDGIGSAPLLCEALPVWLWNEIAPEDESA